MKRKKRKDFNRDEAAVQHFKTIKPIRVTETMKKVQAARDEGFNEGVRVASEEAGRKSAKLMKDMSAKAMLDLSGVWHQVEQYATQAKEHAEASALYARNLSSMYKAAAGKE